METFSQSLRDSVKTLGLGLGFGGTGRTRAALIHVALIAIFGVYLPWIKGVDFMDPVITAAYACLGILFAAPAAAQVFKAAVPLTMPAAMTRVAVAVLYGELMAAVNLAAGFATVYATHRRSFVLGPDLETLTGGAALGLTASVALAAAAGWITLRFSAGAARGALRVTYLLLLALFLFRSRWLPDVALRGALLALLAAVAAIFALRSVVRSAV